VSKATAVFVSKLPGFLMLVCTPQLHRTDVLQGFIDFFSIDPHVKLMNSGVLSRDTLV